MGDSAQRCRQRMEWQAAEAALEGMKNDRLHCGWRLDLGDDGRQHASIISFTLLGISEWLQLHHPSKCGAPSRWSRWPYDWLAAITLTSIPCDAAPLRTLWRWARQSTAPSSSSSPQVRRSQLGSHTPPRPASGASARASSRLQASLSIPATIGAVSFLAPSPSQRLPWICGGMRLA